MSTEKKATHQFAFMCSPEAGKSFVTSIRRTRSFHLKKIINLSRQLDFKSEFSQIHHEKPTNQLEYLEPHAEEVR